MLLNSNYFLFDMDGTLIDSTANIERIWSRWCQRHGIALERVMAICHGIPGASTVRQVAPHLDAAAESAWLDQEEASDSEGVVAVAGAAALLCQLPPERWAVVTSASRTVMEKRLVHCGLPLPRFSICSDDIQHGKPHPEPYLLGAALLGAPPEDCMAFEDASAGMASALAAGCRVVQIGQHAPTPAGITAKLADWQGVSVPAWQGVSA
ncbi:HAD-IA family hydrolase [Chitinibacteraceae bacterium HSL-7]